MYFPVLIPFIQLTGYRVSDMAPTISVRVVVLFSHKYMEANLKFRNTIQYNKKRKQGNQLTYISADMH